MLKPFDGAVRVRLPEGIQCWEKETMNPCQGGFEPSYSYSVDTDHLELDYYGRVKGLQTLNEATGEWHIVVNFFPVTTNAVNRMRDAINNGWAKHSELLIPKDVDEGVTMPRMMGARGYLAIYEEVMDTIMSYQRGSLDV